MIRIDVFAAGECVVFPPSYLDRKSGRMYVDANEAHLSSLPLLLLSLPPSRLPPPTLPSRYGPRYLFFSTDPNRPSTLLELRGILFLRITEYLRATLRREEVRVEEVCWLVVNYADYSECDFFFLRFEGWEVGG